MGRSNSRDLFQPEKKKAKKKKTTSTDDGECLASQRNILGILTLFCRRCSTACSQPVTGVDSAQPPLIPVAAISASLHTLVLVSG